MKFFAKRNFSICKSQNLSLELALSELKIENKVDKESNLIHHFSNDIFFHLLIHKIDIVSLNFDVQVLRIFGELSDLDKKEQNIFFAVEKVKRITLR